MDVQTSPDFVQSMPFYSTNIVLLVCFVDLVLASFVFCEYDRIFFTLTETGQEICCTHDDLFFNVCMYSSHYVTHKNVPTLMYWIVEPLIRIRWSVRQFAFTLAHWFFVQKLANNIDLQPYHSLTRESFS